MKKFKLNLQLFAEEEPEALAEENADKELNIAEELSKIKEGYVPKEKLEAAEKQIRDLMSAAVNGFGSKSKEEEKEPQKRPIDDIRKDLFGRDCTNLEAAKLSLELRTRLMEEGKPDPFIPVGRQISPTEEDIAAANRVAEVFQQCIDYADGDHEVFTNELQRRTIDTQRFMKNQA